MSEHDLQLNIGAVILAAGASTRMGRPKQSLQFRGASLLRRAVQAASDAGCAPVVVVTGANAEASRRELDGLAVIEALNVHWETGMGSSIRAGLETLLEGSASIDAVVLLLCDQPFVTPDILSGLMNARRETGRSIVASQYGDDFGPPALFPKELFPELLRLDGCSGAKQVIRNHAHHALFIPFPDGEIDIDTPDDYARLT